MNIILIRRVISDFIRRELKAVIITASHTPPATRFGFVIERIIVTIVIVIITTTFRDLVGVLAELTLNALSRQLTLNVHHLCLRDNILCLRHGRISLLRCTPIFIIRVVKATKTSDSIPVTLPPFPLTLAKVMHENTAPLMLTRLKLHVRQGALNRLRPIANA